LSAGSFGDVQDALDGKKSDVFDDQRELEGYVEILAEIKMRFQSSQINGRAIGASAGYVSEALNAMDRAEDALRKASESLSAFGRDVDSVIDMIANK
jgi:hypothetical protein